MTRFSSIFSQLLQLFPRLEFEQAVKKHKAERGAKGFTCWGQFVAMMFCQLGRAHSLREICGGTGQLRREAEASWNSRGAEEVDAGVCEPASVLGAVPDAVRAGVGQMPVDGSVVGI